MRPLLNASWNDSEAEWERRASPTTTLTEVVPVCFCFGAVTLLFLDDFGARMWVANPAVLG